MPLELRVLVEGLIFVFRGNVFGQQLIKFIHKNKLIFLPIKSHTVFYNFLLFKKKTLLTEYNISFNGQYDLPGYSAELCCVSTLENSKNKIKIFP